MNGTLAEKIEGNFNKVKLEKTLVKIPKLKPRKTRTDSKRNHLKQARETPTSVIIGILLKAAAERKKGEREKKNISVDPRQYRAVRDESPLLENAGYGTISRAYGGMIKSPYLDYGKLFSYLGNFKSRNAFEDIEGTPTQLTNRVLDEGNKFYFVDREVIDTGVRTMKYFTSGASNGELGIVPVGVNSSDWEKFKLWMKIDPIMFQLKMNTL